MEKKKKKICLKLMKIHYLSPASTFNLISRDVKFHQA